MRCVESSHGSSKRLVAEAHAAHDRRHQRQQPRERHAQPERRGQQRRAGAAVVAPHRALHREGRRGDGEQQRRQQQRPHVPPHAGEEGHAALSERATSIVRKEQTRLRVAFQVVFTVDFKFDSDVLFGVGETALNGRETRAESARPYSQFYSSATGRVWGPGGRGWDR